MMCTTIVPLKRAVRPCCNCGTRISSTVLIVDILNISVVLCVLPSSVATLLLSLAVRAAAVNKIACCHPYKVLSTWLCCHPYNMALFTYSVGTTGIAVQQHLHVGMIYHTTTTPQTCKRAAVPCFCL